MGILLVREGPHRARRTFVMRGGTLGIAPIESPYRARGAAVRIMLVGPNGWREAATEISLMGEAPRGEGSVAILEAWS